jgi:hypothetical protein
MIRRDLEGECSPFILLPDAPDSKRAAAPFRLVAATDRNSHGTWNFPPGTSAEHLQLAGWRSRWIDVLRVGVVAGIVPVGSPLPHVAQHVVQVPAVRLLAPDGMRVVVVLQKHRGVLPAVRIP